MGSEKANVSKLPFYGFEGTGVGSFPSVREMDTSIIDICREENDFFGGYSIRRINQYLAVILHFKKVKLEI